MGLFNNVLTLRGREGDKSKGVKSSLRAHLRAFLGYQSDSLFLNKNVYMSQISKAHLSNPEVRIKKMQPKFEDAVRTPMKRASKQAPT